MTLYALDTDTLSLYERGDLAVSRAVQARSPGEVVITVISVEEQLSGWYTLLRRTKSDQQLARVYQRLADAVQHLASLPILPFTVPAIQRSSQLLKMLCSIVSREIRSKP